MRLHLETHFWSYFMLRLTCQGIKHHLAMGNVNVGTLENRKQIGLIKGYRKTPTNTGMLP